MRTRDKIRIVKAFKSGKSIIECFAMYTAAKGLRDIEDVIRWAFIENKSNS